MQSSVLSLQRAKELDLVNFLQTLGHLPQKIKGFDHWYLSPLHTEKVPSFKVNRKLNAWYDHSLGKGGNLVDFGILYFGCSIKELLQKLPPSLYFHQQNPSILPHQNEVEPAIKITSTAAISHPVLLHYLSERNIPFDLAKNYLEEVYFRLHEKPYYALGFKNNSGGYELRNKYFKGSSSPKDITLIDRGGTGELLVMEGAFSFLSYLALIKDHMPHLTNFLVLNSLSFFERSLEIMEQYPKIGLCLDNDPSGDKCTQLALQASSRFEDRRSAYKGHKDLNALLISKRQVQHPKRGLRP